MSEETVPYITKSSPEYGDFSELLGHDWRRPSRRLTKKEIIHHGWIVIDNGGGQAIMCDTERIHHRGGLIELKIRPVKLTELGFVDV